MTVDPVYKGAQSSDAGRSYAEHFAEQYDEWFGFAAPTADTVELLHELAGAGPVLELGIGTGRVALPLAALHAELRRLTPTQPPR